VNSVKLQEGFAVCIPVQRSRNDG